MRMSKEEQLTGIEKLAPIYYKVMSKQSAPISVADKMLLQNIWGSIMTGQINLSCDDCVISALKILVNWMIKERDIENRQRQQQEETKTPEQPIVEVMDRKPRKIVKKTKK